MNRLEIYRRGEVWYYRFSLNGKRVRRSTGETLRRRAQRIADEAFEAAKLRERGREPVPTLAGLCRLWLAAKEPVASDSHARGMRCLLRHHLGELAGMQIDEVDTTHIERARNTHLATHGRSTTNLWLRRIRMLYGFAIEREMIRFMPWRLKPLKTQKKVRPVLSAEHVPAFLDAIAAVDPRRVVSVAVRLMLAFGLREAETRTARWEWLDWERRTYTPGRTKGREAQPLHVPAWLSGYLVAERRPAGLIISRQNGAELPPKFTARAIRQAGERIGIVGLTPHRIRATFATIALEAGTSVVELQRVMRHRDVRTTLGYIHTTEDAAAAPAGSMFERMGLQLAVRGKETAVDDGEETEIRDPKPAMPQRDSPDSAAARNFTE